MLGSWLVTVVGFFNGKEADPWSSGVPRNFVPGREGSTNSVEDRENGDLGAVAP